MTAGGPRLLTPVNPARLRSVPGLLQLLWRKRAASATGIVDRRQMGGGGKMRCTGGVLAACARGAAIAAVALFGAAPAAFGATSSGQVASETCRGCHGNESPSWKENYHSKMVRASRDALLPAAVERWSGDAKGNAGPSRGNIDGKTYGLDQVVLVVTSKWKQRFLVKVPSTGTHQFLDKQWNAYTKLWENYGNSADWETVCGTCHSKPNGFAEHGIGPRLDERAGDASASGRMQARLGQQ
jgi:cytochrome c553